MYLRQWNPIKYYNNKSDYVLQEQKMLKAQSTNGFIA